MVLEIFNNEHKLEYEFEYKLGGFDTWELFPDISDYKLEFMTQKFKNLDEIQHTEIFAVVKFALVKLQSFTIMLRHYFLLNLI